MSDNVEKRFETDIYIYIYIYNVTLNRDRVNTVAGKVASITHSGCVSVALIIQHAKRMRGIILSPVPRPAVQYFSALSHKRNDFLKKKKCTEYKMWAFIFSTNFVRRFSHSQKK